MPPKNALVVQKLQPMGQPTDEMMVADVVSAAAGIFTPSTRRSNAEEKSGWWMGASTSSPRNSRIQAMPSPFTMWSASSMVSTPGMAAMCPPTTTVVPGESSRTMRHISCALPMLTMIDEMPTISY